MKQLYRINRTYIQNKSVSSAGRSVRPKLSGSTAGKKSVFVVRPTDWTSVAQGLFRWVQAQDRNLDTPS